MNPVRELKIGFVNVDRLFSESPQAELARQRLNSEFESRRRELCADLNRLDILEAELIEHFDAENEAERECRAEQLSAQRKRHRRLVEDFNDDLSRRREKEHRDIGRQLLEIARRFAATKQYDLIVTSEVIAASARADITELILQYARDTGESTTAADAEQVPCEPAGTSTSVFV